jgi:hypothetical protein
MTADVTRRRSMGSPEGVDLGAFGVWTCGVEVELVAQV